jgi:hypothetical protein
MSAKKKKVSSDNFLIKIESYTGLLKFAKPLQAKSGAALFKGSISISVKSHLLKKYIYFNVEVISRQDITQYNNQLINIKNCIIKLTATRADVRFTLFINNDSIVSTDLGGDEEEVSTEIEELDF